MVGGKIGVGVVGASLGWGWGAQVHIPALMALAEYEVRALSTTRAESAEQAARHFGVPFFCTDNAALVARPDVDLVAITVKVPDHLALVRLAIDAGKHVYCEWPLGNGLDEAVAMAKLARARGVVGVTGLQGRSAPAIAFLRQLLADGYVGEVLSTSLVASGMGWGATLGQSVAYTADDGNGATMLSIGLGHTVDALCDLLGEFDSLGATMATRRKTSRIVETGDIIPLTVADQIAVNGTLTGGTVASIHYRAGTSRGTNLLWEINGTEGDLRMTASGGAVQCFDVAIEGGRGDDGSVSPLAIPAAHYLAPRPEPMDYWVYNVRQAYRRLADDLRDGTRLLPSFDDAIVRHRMLEAIRRAAATGERQSYA